MATFYLEDARTGRLLREATADQVDAWFDAHPDDPFYVKGREVIVTEIDD